MFSLPKRRVLVKPILREGKWLSKGHSGNFMYDNAKMLITVPLSEQSGQLLNPLTTEEVEYFENKEVSGLDFNKGDLSPYKKPDAKHESIPYWYAKEIIITKNDGVLDEDTVLLELDLSNPLDYIDYKVLLANSRYGGVVAPSWDKRYDQGTYKIALVDSEYKSESESNRAKKLAEAYKFFTPIMNSQIRMYEFLMVYWLENKNSAKPARDSNVNWLSSEIQKIIDNSVDKFLKTVNSNYEDKLLIHQAIEAGALNLVGNTFVTVDGVPVGNSISEVILYFKDERNQEQRLKLIALSDSNK
jgi:hypothetical protein